LKVIVPATVSVAAAIVPADVIVVNGVENVVEVKVAALPVLLIVACAFAVPASPSATVSAEAVGFVSDEMIPTVSVEANAALKLNVEVTVSPTRTVAVGVVTVMAVGVDV
jgi:hypothetical protein